MKINKIFYLILISSFLSCNKGKMKVEDCLGCLFESGGDIIHLTTITEFPEYTFINMHELNSADVKITSDSVYLIFYPGIEDAEVYARIGIDKRKQSGSLFVKGFHEEWEEFYINLKNSRLVLSKTTNNFLRIGGYIESQKEKEVPEYEEKICTRNNFSFLITVSSDSVSKELPHLVFQ